jgi:hypothetical protein
MHHDLNGTPEVFPGNRRETPLTAVLLARSRRDPVLLGFWAVGGFFDRIRKNGC